MESRTDDDPWAEEAEEVDTWQDEPQEPSLGPRTTGEGHQPFEAGGDDDYPEDDSLIYGDEEREGDPRRSQAATAMVLAAIFFVFSLVVVASFNVTGGAFGGAFDFWSLRTWIWIFLVVMVGFLIWLLVLLFSAPARDEDWYSESGDDRTFAEYADEPGAADTITLRCPKCVNIFTLQDPWTRPFYHRCPHCDAQGVYTGSEDPPEVKEALERQGQVAGV